MVYLDNLIIFCRTWSDHLSNLCLVFDRLKKAGLKAKPSKFRFDCGKVKYLGHIVLPEGVECDTDKTTAIAQYPRPCIAINRTDKKENHLFEQTNAKMHFASSNV